MDAMWLAAAFNISVCALADLQRRRTCRSRKCTSKVVEPSAQRWTSRALRSPRRALSALPFSLLYINPISHDEDEMFSPPKCMRAPGGGTGALNHAIVIVKNGLVNPLYVCVAENTLEVASNTACLIILRLTTEHLQLNKKTFSIIPMLYFYCTIH